MKKLIFQGLCLFIPGFALISCQTSAPKPDNASGQLSAQSAPVGGGCETCELMYAGMPAEINSVDTSAGWYEEGRKLIIHGKVFKIDGVSPASDVVLYYWQTDNTGRYTPDENTNSSDMRHGHIRGWVKTNSQGEYTLYTIRPAAYPDGGEPEHIHFLVREPDIANEYYIDDMVFADDPILEKSMNRRRFNNRGGSGIVAVKKEGNVQIATHKIILGLNIPGY